MRIISGQHKGFVFPKKNMPHTRPTTDRGKEALFNIIDQHFYFEDIDVLDLYAGLGSITFEFVSREVKSITCIEGNSKSIRYIEEIKQKLAANLEVRQSKVLSYLKSSLNTFDVIFADPPYMAGQEIQDLIKAIENGSYLNNGGVFILEHQSNIKMNHWACYDTRKYGQSTFSFFNFEKQAND